MTRRLLALGILAGVVAIADRYFLRCEVEGESMSPGLQPGDRLLLRRRSGCGALKPGAIVALGDPRPGPQRLLIKRVLSDVDGMVTVIGDNPSASTDSRNFGAVPRSAIRWVLVRRYGVGPAGAAESARRAGAL
jgi:nickel-type superoxide dismutase maturation protease